MGSGPEPPELSSSLGWKLAFRSQSSWNLHFLAQLWVLLFVVSPVQLQGPPDMGSAHRSHEADAPESLLGFWGNIHGMVFPSAPLLQLPPTVRVREQS